MIAKRHAREESWEAKNVKEGEPKEEEEEARETRRGGDEVRLKALENTNVVENAVSATFQPKNDEDCSLRAFLSASDRRASPKFRPNRPAAFGCVNSPMNLHNWSKKFHPGRNFWRQFGRNFCDSVASLPLLSFFFSSSLLLFFSSSLLLFLFFCPGA